MSVTDVAIVGAGPAGLAAAIQLKRYGIEFRILERERIGGLLTNAHLVENYPGFPKGISGPALVRSFKRQLRNFGIKVEFNEVKKIDSHDDLFCLSTSQGSLSSRTAVIASGTVPRKLPGLHIPLNALDCVFYEVFPLVRMVNKKIAVIGSGDAAFDYAMGLSIRNEVLILSRGNRAKCLPLLWKRVRENPKIVFLGDIRLDEIRRTDGGLRLSYSTPKEKQEREVSFVVIAIGREPRLDFLSDQLNNNFETLKQSRRFFIIGDVKNNLYRQTAIATGDGIRAAMEIYEQKEGGSR